MWKKIFSFLIYVVLPLGVIAWVFEVPFFKNGLIVGGDWIFPYTRSQMIQFGNEAWHLWTYREIPMGTQTPHQNLYLFAMFIGLLGQWGMNGVQFQRVFIFVIISSIYLSFYICFSRRWNRQFPAMMGGLVYVFSPVVFNYFIMGWWFVLMYMAMAPWLLQWSWSYWRSGKLKYLLGSGLLFVIGFWQAQTLVWIPLIWGVTGLMALGQIDIKRLLKRVGLAILVIGGIMVLGHGSWMYAVGMAPENYVIGKTSEVDVNRFAQISQLFNQLRGWGALYNEQYEFSFIKSLQSLSYISVGLLIINLITNKTKKYKKWLTVALLLVLIPPSLYLCRQFVSHLPLSNIIRDTSRFTVFTQLGLAMGVTLFFILVKKKLVVAGVSLLLLLMMHPYWLGRMHTPEYVNYGNAQYNKDQRIRILSVNQDEIEGIMDKEHIQRGLLFPTGGALSTEGVSQFHGSFAEVSDYDAFFSPYASGIYVSDKSNPRIKGFADNYFWAAHQSPQIFFEQSRKFGIDRIFVRKNLVSNFDKELQMANFIDQCVPTGLRDSNWSITQICRIQNPLPYIYLARVGGIGEAGIEVENDCLSGDDKECIEKGALEFAGDKITMLNSSIPNGYKKIIVLNNTWHPGWKVITQEGQNLKYDHIVVNKLVNGWILPDDAPKVLRIVFEPDLVYQRLVSLGMGGLTIVLISWIYLVIRDKWKI